MGYSTAMTNETVPDISPGYPSKGARLGPAWEHIWRILETDGGYLDGHELAETAAQATGLAPSTLVALISRAGRAGILERRPKPVQTQRGNRMRTFYKIKPKYRTKAS